MNLQSKTSGKFIPTHGMYGTRLYHIWSGMNNRCRNKKLKDYSLYGGRGITVCEEWKKPENFFKWALANGYNDNLTIDRIDCNKGYSPNNCRWITIIEQQKNKRNNHVLEFNGEKHCIAEWARITGLSRYVITGRLKRGWPIEKVLTVPAKEHKKWGKKSK